MAEYECEFLGLFASVIFIRATARLGVSFAVDSQSHFFDLVSRRSLAMHP